MVTVCVWLEDFAPSSIQSPGLRLRGTYFIVVDTVQRTGAVTNIVIAILPLYYISVVNVLLLLYTSNIYHLLRKVKTSIVTI